MIQCQIAMGGNIGDVRGAFGAALSELHCPDFRVVAVSQCFETPPMGDDAGAAFLNGAATVETTLDAETVLERLLAAEERLGRVRKVQWGPRVIDLDLILYDEVVLDTPSLRVPHPASWYRRFVLEPLAEIAPDAVHPEAGETLAVLRERLLVRPFRVAVDNRDVRERLQRAFAKSYPEVIWVDASDRGAAITLRVEQKGSSAAERAIGVSPEPSLLVSSVRAILMAAVGEPRVVGPMGPLPL